MRFLLRCSQRFYARPPIDIEEPAVGIDHLDQVGGILKQVFVFSFTFQQGLLAVGLGCYVSKNSGHKEGNIIFKMGGTSSLYEDGCSIFAYEGGVPAVNSLTVQ